MDQSQFKSLLKYYLLCLDWEEAANLKLIKSQENKTYIFPGDQGEEQLFTGDMPQVAIRIDGQQQKNFILQKAIDKETIADLYYGYPVFRDEKDMLSPLFYASVDATFTNEQTLRLIPKEKNIFINRVHLLNNFDAGQIEVVCRELEGAFGSFEARMKAAEAHIPSLNSASWIWHPVLFRASLNKASSGLRYDLSYLLEKQDVLSPNTALSHFFNTTSDKGKVPEQFPVLEMGELNAEQEESVMNGLCAPLSVVTGPPGTGKTQVVTALLASAVFNNQTVLFASNNNAPVDGVYKKLGACLKESGNWIMRLGNQEKRDACFKTINALLEKIEVTEDDDVLQLKETFWTIENNIRQIKAELDSAKVLNEKIRAINLREAAITGKLPDSWVEEFSETEPQPFDKTSVTKFGKHCSRGLLLWLMRKLRGLESFRDKHNTMLGAFVIGKKTLQELNDYMLIDEPWDAALRKSREMATFISLHQQWAAFVAHRRSLEDQLRRLPSIMDLRRLKKEKTIVSQQLLDKYWLHNIHTATGKAKEALQRYFRDIEYFSAGRHKRMEKSMTDLMQFFPVWSTTNQSANAVLPTYPGIFDLVVIDEAGQCNIPSILPLLYRAKRAVIIGDPNQFRHITTIKPDRELVIATASGIAGLSGDWSFTSRSAFDRAFSATQKVAFLKQHYRCHPDIIEFSNQSFYEGKLIAQTASLKYRKFLPIKENGLVWDHTPGEAVRAAKGAWNPAEMDKVAATFERWAGHGLFSKQELTYGIISPYRKQVEELQKRMCSFPWFQSVASRFIIGTAHSFQGSECDVLVYSPVVSANMDGHLLKFAATQTDLINVTVTRAKSLLYIVGDVNACQAAADTPLHQLATYARQLHASIKFPMSEAEKLMGTMLEGVALNFIPQFPLGPYRLDFMVTSPSGEKYDLEVDGDQHWSSESVRHDERRDAYVEGKGFKVLRITARDVFHRREAIQERLIRL